MACPAMFSNQTFPSIVSSLLFGPTFNGTHSSVSPLVSPSVSSSSHLASPIKEALDSALNCSVANISMSVDGGGEAVSTPSYPSGLIIWIVLLVVALGFLVLYVSALIKELDASDARLAALEDTLAETRQEAEDLARKSNDQCFDLLLEMSGELNRLQDENGDLEDEVDDLKESIDDLQAEYDDLEPSYNAITLAYEVLEHYSNTIEARGQDLDKENKDLQALNTSLLEENTNLLVSMHNLDRDRSSLRSLYALTCDQNAHLHKTLKRLQDTSAENALQAKLSTTAFSNALTKIAVFDEHVDYYKDLVASKDKLILAAIEDNQHLLFSLAALKDENARLTKAASDQETDIANKDTEISALRCEISLHETASSRAEEEIKRLFQGDVARKAQFAEIDRKISVLRNRLELVSDQYADKIVKQKHANKRLLEAAAEREDYIGVLHDIVSFYDEKREEAEKELAWHRLAFEEERECARGEVFGAKEAGAEQHEDDGGIGLESAAKPSVDTYDLLFPPLPNASSSTPSGVDQLIEEPDVPTNDTSIREEGSDQSSDIADDGFTSEEHLDTFSDVADDTSIIDSTSIAATIVLTESEASADSDFESVGLSDGDSEVDVLLE